MKKWMLWGIFMLLLPWLLALICMKGTGQAVWGSENRIEKEEDTLPSLDGKGGENRESEAEEEDAETSAGSISRRILIERDGIQTYMNLEDYLPGVVACQIPEGYEWEALKCQTVIARTYICRLMDGRQEIQEEELDLDYIGQANGSENRFLTLGEKERLAEKLIQCKRAAGETKGVVMRCDDQYVLPLFHRISSGRTRNGSEEYPYLVSVESRWDVEAENYQQVFSWSRETFAQKISQIPGAAPVRADQVPEQIQTVEKDEAGYLTEMKIGSGIYKGEEIQYTLGLPSSCFYFNGTESGIQAVVRGIGHGYGLSQTGAAHMAAEGWDYQDILHYYYKNISLVTE